MKIQIIILIGILAFTSVLSAPREPCYIESKGSLHFPANFSFGVSTSAYQIEGGWDEDGKGVSLWDDFSHNFPELIADGSNGDIAADSYHLFDDDLKILKDLKVGHYRFSVAWSRIFPNGDVSFKNQPGIDYYNDIIDKLLENGITPMLTMHHFNIPLEIQKTGGFASPLIIDYFVNFATELFEKFGDRVKHWITFNEPLRLCNGGYGDGTSPPRLNHSGVGNYICIHNLLKAHGAAYKVYKEKFFDEQGGQIGIAIDTTYFYLTNSSDSDLFERAMQFNMGYLAHPILSEDGGYPEIMVQEIARNSQEEGRYASRLPSFDEEWKDIIRGSADFLGLNYYSSSIVKRPSEPIGKNPSFERDMNVEISSDASKCDPSGLEDVLHWVRKEYNNIPMIVTENGWRDEGEVEDYDRAYYIKGHLQAVLNAVNDGCNIYSYTHWSLLDNFEWVFGYTINLGLYGIDRTTSLLERYPKTSARFYKKIIKHRISPNKLDI